MQLYIFEDNFMQLIEQYQLTEEQLKFTGTPQKCLELAKADANRHSILAIDEGKLVVFFVLHRNEGVKPYSNNENAILIRAFSTDNRYQGKGYAKKALMLLPEFVKEHFSGINEIVLAVNVKNEAAQGLYKKCGYIDKGERVMGIKGELIVMSYEL
ncbi:GNAT family N-acetyltransferase [Lysinibacillus sp. CD3-6]|uniref:GNAT family N-acetyltransferase n=1 Tax=Lysinibacillus sp. CD3-6 TaxID=2892541 RepID=UPI00116B5EAD|nr:GNAT family N-acetyltransferase [Lysinibacillus sp. CD3-6]UED82405.1 GNAT family N-acetyltransferase [Lysinibacillus sp. CD3-6]